MSLWLRSVIVGFGMFGISAAWPLYDFFMPLFYAQFIGSGALIGAIMAIDNVMALTLQPYFGALSDRIHTRRGRRAPYLLVGAPAAALCLAAVPLARTGGLLPLVTVTLLFNLAMAMFRSPTIALMPDLVPEQQRSQAHGIINFMSSLGAAVPLLFGIALFARSPYLPFLLSASVLLAVSLVYWRWLREPPAADTPAGPAPLRDAARSLFRARNRQTLLMMSATFLWSLAFQAGNSWFSTYATRTLGMTEKAASQLLFVFVAALALTAIPAGILGGWAGRRRSMVLGALVMAAGDLMLAAGPARFSIPVALITAAVGWSLLVVNSYPALVEQAGRDEHGTYTGLYFVALQGGAILAPPLLGWVKDVAGWAAFWALAAAALLACAGVAAVSAWQRDRPSGRSWAKTSREAS